MFDKDEDNQQMTNASDFGFTEDDLKGFVQEPKQGDALQGNRRPNLSRPLRRTRNRLQTMIRSRRQSHRPRRPTTRTSINLRTEKATETWARRWLKKGPAARRWAMS